MQETIRTIAHSRVPFTAPCIVLQHEMTSQFTVIY
jgi:hypothetical protein